MNELIDLTDLTWVKKYVAAVEIGRSGSVCVFLQLCQR